MSLLGRATWTSCFSRIVWGEGRSKSKRGKNKQRENGAWFLLFAARESERTACSFLEKRVARIPALKRPCGTRGSARISANVETILSSEFQSRFSTTRIHSISLYRDTNFEQGGRQPVPIKPKIPRVSWKGTRRRNRIHLAPSISPRKWSRVARHFSMPGRGMIRPIYPFRGISLDWECAPLARETLAKIYRRHRRTNNWSKHAFYPGWFVGRSEPDECQLCCRLRRVIFFFRLWNGVGRFNNTDNIESISHGGGHNAIRVWATRTPNNISSRNFRFVGSRNSSSSFLISKSIVDIFKKKKNTIQIRIRSI